jgi:hypothetical protein
MSDEQRFSVFCDTDACTQRIAWERHASDAVALAREAGWLIGPNSHFSPERGWQGSDYCPACSKDKSKSFFMLGTSNE